MDRTRRDFIRWTAFAAAGLASGLGDRTALAGPKGRGLPPSDSHKGTSNPDMRKRLESGNVTSGPEYQAPEKPLDLPPWRYGKSSTAPDTVLMFRGNPSRTFYGTGPIPDKLRVHWKYRMEDFKTELRGKPITWQGTGWTGTAVKYGNYVFVGSVGRNFYAFEADTGKVAWRWRSPRMFKSSATYYDNRIYIGNVDDWLRCFDAATGKIVWKMNSGNDLDSSPVIVDGRLYIAGEAGYARCIDPADGKVIWQTKTGGTGPGTLGGSNGSETSPAIADGEYYLVNYFGEVWSLNTSDGSLRWKASTGADTDASPVVSGDFVYAAAEEDNSHLFCFARKDGREVWRYSDNRRGYWSTPAVVGNRLWIGGQDHNLHCLDATTGKPIWKFKTGAPIWCSPAVVDDRVVFGGIDGFLYVLDAKTGQEITKLDAGGRFLSSPCVVGGRIWMGTATGNFFCFGA